MWTGGWDSTFRLLHLVLIERKAVQPYYIINGERRSSFRELKTIRTIKDGVAQRSRESAALIEPLHIVSIYDIDENQFITEKYQRLRQQMSLGTQHDWLARFADQYHFNDLEYCIHSDDNASLLIKSSKIERVASKNTLGGCWQISSEKADEDISILLPFQFPILNLTKIKMKEIAREQGFLDLLELSWFCRHPIQDQPCGLCYPCHYAIKEGMSYRFPQLVLMRHKLLFPFVRFWRRLNAVS